MTAPIAHYRFVPGEFDADAWDGLITAAAGHNLIQTWAYGEAKAAQGPWRAERGTIVDGGGARVGAAQAMVRRVPVIGGGIAWINRGPLSLDADGEVRPTDGHQAAMLAALKRHFCDQRGLYLRLAPMVAQSAFDPAWATAAGLTQTAVPGWASAVVDLTQPPDTLRNCLHRKWRNHLAKAERADITVRQGHDAEIFTAFLDGHHAHLERLGPEAGLDAGLLTALQACLPQARKFYLLLASVDGEPASGMAFVKYGRSAEYLAGHNNPLGRGVNAGQLLLWTAINRLRADGFERLDLGGMDEHATTPGIFEFKQRVGGTPYRLANELESIPNSLVGRLVRASVARARPGA